MSTITIVDRLHSEYQALVSLLQQHAEPSLLITADDTFRKVLLLSAASHFERLVIEAIDDCISKCTSNDRIREFARRKGLHRQYHTLFDWERGNANPFFSLFGEEFKVAMDLRVRSDESLASSIRSFLELGRERNRLVHQDLGQFALEKTAEEIYLLYRRAASFVEEIPNLLMSEAQQ